MSFTSEFVRIVNKIGTAVGVTDNNELKVNIDPNSDPIPVTLSDGGTTRTASISRNTNTTGTVTAGARSVSFFNAGSDDCTIKTVTLAAGEVVTFEAGGEDDTLDAIAWTANTSAATVILITEVR